MAGINLKKNILMGGSIRLIIIKTILNPE